MDQLLIKKEDPLLTLVKQDKWVQKLPDCDRELFDIGYEIALRHKSTNNYVINWRDVIEWTEETQGIVAEITEEVFIEDEDYKIISLTPSFLETTKREYLVLLTVQCTLDLCYILNERGMKICKYYEMIRQSHTTKTQNHLQN